MLELENPVLICVDIQQGFQDAEYWGGGRNNENAEAVCASIIAKWRELGLKIIHVQHSSSNPESPLHSSSEGFAFHELAEPMEGEPIVEKSVNSAFIGTDLKELLDKANAASVVIIGLTTDHCVSTTARMAGNFGYNTFVVSDAAATFDKVGLDGRKFDAEIIHQTALASLNNEFAMVLTSDDLLASL